MDCIDLVSVPPTYRLLGLPSEVISLLYFYLEPRDTVHFAVCCEKVYLSFLECRVRVLDAKRLQCLINLGANCGETFSRETLQLDWEGLHPSRSCVQRCVQEEAMQGFLHTSSVRLYRPRSEAQQVRTVSELTSIADQLAPGLTMQVSEDRLHREPEVGDENHKDKKKKLLSWKALQQQALEDQFVALDIRPEDTSFYLAELCAEDDIEIQRHIHAALVKRLSAHDGGKGPWNYQSRQRCHPRFVEVTADAILNPDPKLSFFTFHYHRSHWGSNLFENFPIDPATTRYFIGIPLYHHDLDDDCCKVSRFVETATSMLVAVDGERMLLMYDIPTLEPRYQWRPWWCMLSEDDSHPLWWLPGESGIDEDHPRVPQLGSIEAHTYF